VAANQTWAVDFIHDSLISGRHFRAFSVLDQWSRESLAIEVDVSVTGERVTRVLERLRTFSAGQNWFRTGRCGLRPLRREHRRRVVTQCAVWLHLVVVLSPALELVAHVGERKEYLDD
jgi:transposase InsO family protein